MNIPVFLGIYVLKRNLVLCLFIECIGLKGGIHIILLHGLKYVNSIFEGHEYQGIVGYIYTWNEVNTIPVYSLYYPKGRDSHYLTDKAEVDRFIRERGDQYGGILGYVYP